MTEPSREQVDEIGLMTREQELAFELRTVKHDLEHVVVERGQAERQVQVLEERIRKALECLDGLDDFGAVMSAESPSYPRLNTVSSTVIRNFLTGAALDGEGEPESPAQPGAVAPVGAAFEDQTMPDSRADTRTSE